MAGGLEFDCCLDGEWRKLIHVYPVLTLSMWSKWARLVGDALGVEVEDWIRNGKLRGGSYLN